MKLFLKSSTYSYFSRALAEADVILLLGARLNWILHFGKPPRFRDNVKVLQVSIYMCVFIGFIII